MARGGLTQLKNSQPQEFHLLDRSGSVSGMDEPPDHQRSFVQILKDTAKYVYRCELLSTHFHNHPPSTRAFRAVVLFVLLAKLCREVWWVLVLTPFALLLACASFSGICTVLTSPATWLVLFSLWGRLLAASPHLDALTRRAAPACVRSKVVLRAGWKRARPLLDAKVAQGMKGLVHFATWLGGGGVGTSPGPAGGNRQQKGRQTNLRALVASALALVLYTSVSSMFWTLHYSPADHDGHGGHGEGVGGVSSSSTMPSLSRPFVFLHVPGSGGVSFRKGLHADAVALRASRFLPCYGGLKCAINTEQEFNKTYISLQTHASQLTILQREMRCATVIAGHFKFSLLSVLLALDGVNRLAAAPSSPSSTSALSSTSASAIRGGGGGVATAAETRRGGGGYGSSAACPPRRWFDELRGGGGGSGGGMAKLPSSSLPFSSLGHYNVVIVLRHPLRRIISHYYRFGQQSAKEYRGRKFSDLTATEVQVFLKQSGENLVLSYLTSAKINEFPNVVEATKNAMANLRQCTVGIFEHWELTGRVLAHRNPWLKPPPNTATASTTAGDDAADASSNTGVGGEEEPNEAVAAAAAVAAEAEAAAKRSVLAEREPPSVLEPLVQGILINRLVAEMRLYEEALRLFRKQLKRVVKAEEQQGGGGGNTAKDTALTSIALAALKEELAPPPLDPAFEPNDENYYRHFVPAPFPFE